MLSSRCFLDGEISIKCFCSKLKVEVSCFFLLREASSSVLSSVAAPAAKKWGAKGDRGFGGGAPQKFLGPRPFLCYAYSRGNAVQMQLNIKEQ